MSMDSPISPKCEIGSRQFPDVVPTTEVDRAPRQFTEDPYTFVEGITVVHSRAPHLAVDRSVCASPGF